MDTILNQTIDGLLIDIAHLRARQTVLAEMTLSVFASLLSKEEYEILELNYSDEVFSKTELELKNLEGVVSDIRRIADEFLKNREAKKNL